jgi:hypothetical protein
MTDRETFLERWSRKKAEAEHDTGHAANAPAEAARIGSDPAPRPTASTDANPTSTEIPKAEFDIASLPSLESITKATDIRAFLTPGVPADLTRAALRRAWATDPAIRDFVGLQENDWDFTKPDGVPGFGDIPPDFDVKKLVSQIFGEPDAAPEPVSGTEQLPAPPETQTTQIADGSEPSALSNTVPLDSKDVDSGRLIPTGVATSFTTAETEGVLVQRNNDTASHNSISETQPAEPKTSRKHGSALPK